MKPISAKIFKKKKEHLSPCGCFFIRHRRKVWVECSSDPLHLQHSFAMTRNRIQRNPPPQSQCCHCHPCRRAWKSRRASRRGFPSCRCTRPATTPWQRGKGTTAFSKEKTQRGPPKAYCPAVVCVQRIEYQLLHLLCLPEKRRGRCIKFVWSITQFRQKASQNIACDIYPCWPPRLGWSLWSCCTTPGM